MTNKRRLAVGAVAASAALVLAGCANGGNSASDSQTVTLRLWDENAAAVYKTIAEEFEAQNSGIDVEVETVPWADYFSGLRQEVAAGQGPDIFWLNGANFAAYVDAGQVAPVKDVIGEDAAARFVPAVVDQYSSKGELYGIPQIFDGGIGLFYNADLLKEAGVDPAELQNLKWSATGGEDTLLPLLQKLTKDSAGRNALDPEFDANNVVQYGFNSAWDIQAILLPFIGSNGGTFQNGEQFTFSTPETEAAFKYIVDLVDTYHVAPPAADTNNNGDFSRDAFLQGRMALFQSGTYNLTNVNDSVSFEWGIAPLPAGDAGAVTVAPGVSALINAASANDEAVKAFAKYLSTAAGNRPFGEAGVAFPAVSEAGDAFQSFWSAAGVDISALVVGADQTVIEPVTGTKFNEAAEVFMPIMREMFLGQRPVSEAVAEADRVANEVVNG
ncbi:ABC transporter substrate-binding protein [Canibacter zhoujuaniae]|uniref:ABC transporter substrate-binding protein n=1 Tax=Canibacter zhoujuaniae TaxID=2708343 RepID=UPI001421E748|nr:sugar ABC transporter substrate-binding protein [Canibacter zhoujuaniae]